MADPISIGIAVASVVSAGTAVYSAATAPRPRAALPRPTVTPRANSAVSDAISARKGVAANMTTGAGGAESGTNAKKTFMGS